MKCLKYLIRPGAALLAAVLLLGTVPWCLASTGGSIWLTGKFNSPAYPGRELSYSFPYRDDYFTRPGTDYQHSLAQCTLGLAVSAFRAADLKLDKKDAYVRDYLRTAGFGDVVSRQFDEKPSADSIATLMASKTLWDGEGEFLLVAVAVSGGGYEDEWLSNFSFGDENVHDGFFSAAYTVLQRVLDYVDTYAGNGRFKLWLGGYSRAAAVSNMTAALALAAEQVGREDLYVYTFATPNNIRTASGNFDLEPYDYSSIYNIVGMFDPVPSVPFQEWGYGKLGTTLRLPAQETTPDYIARRAPVAAVYQTITGTAYVNNPEANWFVQKLYQLMYDMVRTAGSYQRELESVLNEAWADRSSMFRLLRTLCASLSREREVGRMLLGEAPSADTLLSVFFYDLAAEKLGLWPGSWNDLSLMAQLFYEHCPEVYVAWMMSQDDPGKLFVANTGYRRIFLDDGVEYELRDGKGVPAETVCAAKLGRTVMVTVPAGQTYVLALFGGRERERIKVVEYNAGSLHYAYQIYPMEDKAAVYELVLPMELWKGREEGGLSRMPGGDRIAPTAQTLERSQVHPNAVFELEDSGFAASHALDILSGSGILLLGLVIGAPVSKIALILKRRKRRTGKKENGGAFHA